MEGIMTKTQVHELTIGELREVILQAVFGKSDTELSAVCAAHGIEFEPIYNQQKGMRREALQYLNAAVSHAQLVLMLKDYPIARFQETLAICRIPDNVPIWEWDKITE